MTRHFRDGKRRDEYRYLAIAIVLCILLGAAASAAPAPGWKFRSDLANSGVYDDGGKKPAGDLIWTFKTGLDVDSSPAVVNGIIYVGSSDGNLYALHATTGALLWNYTAGGGFGSSPAVANGVIYAGNWNNHIYAVNASTGSPIWDYATGDLVVSSPAVADGVVYVGSWDDNLYALNASTGALLWKFATKFDVDSSPAVSGGIVFAGSEDSDVYALNASTGALLWNYTTGDDVRSSPAVAGGIVYFGSNDKNLYALNATTGALLWKYATGYVVRSSPAVANGVVYAGSDDHYLYALNASAGTLLWKYDAGDGVYSSPAVANGVVYFGTLSYGGRNVLALDASTGALLWGHPTSGDVLSSPAVADGMVFIGSSDGKLYAFGTFPDEPPPGVTHLHAVSTQQLKISWAWTDPDSIGFSHVMVYLDGVFQGNVTKGVQAWTATDLAPSTTYTIGTRTVREDGKINTTWVNDTATIGALSLSHLDPTHVMAGSPSFTLTVNGTGFSPACTILWNGAGQPTQYGGPGTLSLQVPAGLLGLPRLVNITVSDNSGGLSNPLFIFVTDPPSGAKAWKWRSDSRNTGVYDDGGTRPSGILLWNYTTGGNVTSSPTVVNGVVYVGSKDRNLYALNASTGALLWKYNTTEQYDWVSSSPAVADGIVYIGGMKTKVHALNASTGALIWNYTVPAQYTTRIEVSSSPAVAYGTVYIGNYDGNIYALDASSGTLLWNYTTGPEMNVFSSPAVADGVVYVGSAGSGSLRDGRVWALDAATGTLLWNYTFGGVVYNSPAVSDGVVYVGSSGYPESNLLALDAATGTLRWTFTALGFSSPAVANGVVYVGGGFNNSTYALDAATGAQRWKFVTGGRVSSSPAVANGVVYVGSYDKNLYALDAATGARLWNYTTGDGISSSPAVVDGVVYVGGRDWNVYAFGTREPVPPVANFTANTTSGFVPLTVGFTDTSTGDRPLGYQWDFGDGSPNATVQNPIHSYVTEGTYNITLTVNNSAGTASLTRQGYILVMRPIIVGGDKAYYLVHSNVEGASVYFDGNWFEGNITNGTLLVQTCTSCAPVWNFTVKKCGYFPLTQNNTRYPGKNETVDLYANLTAPKEPIIPDFTANVTEGPTPLTVGFTLHPVGIVETLNWSFGDGTHSDERDPVHTYTGAGNYTVSVYAANSACQENTLAKPGFVRVGPPAPFYADVVSGTAPLRVQFTETATGNPWFRLWNFGDSPFSFDGKNPVHVYQSAGTFTVTLTTIDPYLHEFRRTAYIHVMEGPKVDFLTNVTSGFAPLAVQFTDTSTGSPMSWLWDFGDGASSAEQNPVHTYVSGGTYTVRLTASNIAGSGSVTKTGYIVVPILPFSGTGFA